MGGCLRGRVRAVGPVGLGGPASALVQGGGGGGGLAVVCLSHFSWRVESINRTALYADGRSMWRLIDVGPE